MGQGAPAAEGWIVSAPYDLFWFFGGALTSLAVLGLYLVGVPILLLWWTWLLLFDGPHIAAAFTRTYLDREEWSRRGPLLATSLLAFAVGPVCLVLNLLLGSPDPFLLFLALSAFYGYYHVVRQHYGFLALYGAKGGDHRRLTFHLDKWILYVACWTPYFYFLLSHPRARSLLRLPTRAPAPGVETLLLTALAVVWGAAVVTLVTRAFLGAGPRTDRPKVAYLLTTVVLYSLIYFVVARMEPVYAESSGPDQDFLLLSILVTIFHNVQYLGLVWFHNRNRYRGAGDFGPARWLGHARSRYLAACALFSLVVYLSFACSTGVFPRCMILPATRVGPFSASQVGLCLWWGLAIHHYWLDQRIWRVRGDSELRRNLGLA
jgi:hypothetical protein